MAVHFYATVAAPTQTPAVSSPGFDKTVNVDATTPEVRWFLAPKAEPKTLTVDNGGDFDIDWKDALTQGVLIERIRGGGRGSQLTITGQSPRGLKDSLPEIRFWPKSGKSKGGSAPWVVKVLVLPPKKLKVSFYNVADTPSKLGQPSRATTQDVDAVSQMVADANKILKRQTNVEIESAGLGTAKIQGLLPDRIVFTGLSSRGDAERNRAWRESFVKEYLDKSGSDFSVFFWLNFDLQDRKGNETGAVAFSEPDQKGRWYCFQKQNTGGNDGKSLAHETAHTLLGDFFGDSGGHSKYKEELMWPTLEDSGDRIYIETARTMNLRPPAGQ